MAAGAREVTVEYCGSVEEVDKIMKLCMDVKGLQLQPSFDWCPQVLDRNILITSIDTEQRYCEQ